MQALVKPSNMPQIMQDQNQMKNIKLQILEK